MRSTTNTINSACTLYHTFQQKFPLNDGSSQCYSNYRTDAHSYPKNRLIMRGFNQKGLLVENFKKIHKNSLSFLENL